MVKYFDMCGRCGSTETDPKTSMCANCQADQFVNIEDFDNPELDCYVEEACNNLKISRNQLLAIFKEAYRD